MAQQARVEEVAAVLKDRGQHVTPDFRMKPPATAFVVGVPQERLRKWRSEGRGPRYYKGAGPIWYSIHDVLDWLEAQAINPDE